MKKYFLLTGLLILGIAVKSQVLISIIFGDKLNSGKVEFGLDGGFNWSNLKNLDQSKSLRTFNLGFYFDIKLKKPSWMVNTGVIVKSTMGAEDLPVYSLGNPGLDSSFAGGEVATRISYFNVPVMLKYRFKNNIYLKGGIQLGLAYKAYDVFAKSIIDKKDLEYKIKINDHFHPIDAGLAVGAGYRFMKGNGINLGVQYYYGLVDVTTDDSSPGNFNRVFYITVGIPIGVKPKDKKTDPAGK